MNLIKVFRIYIVVWGISFLLLPVCQAQDVSRAGKTEVFGVVQLFQGDSQSTSVGATSVTIDFDDSKLGGIGGGYNFNEYLNLNGELLVGSTDFDFVVNGTPGSDASDIVELNVNVEYNVLGTSLTPVLTGGVGIMIFDGDIGIFDFSEANYSYSLGAGVRWDISNTFFFKALYRKIWTELEDFNDAHQFDTFNIYFGVMF